MSKGYDMTSRTSIQSLESSIVARAKARDIQLRKSEGAMVEAARYEGLIREDKDLLKELQYRKRDSEIRELRIALQHAIGLYVQVSDEQARRLYKCGVRVVEDSSL